MDHVRGMRTRSGFTLVEVLIVVTIVALLSGSAVALFADRFRESAREHFVKNLAAYLRYVQYRAIEHEATHRLTIDGSGALRSMIAEGSDGRFIDLEDPFADRLKRRSDFRLEMERPDGLYYFPDGSTKANRMSVFQDGLEVATLSVTNRVGSVRVEYAPRP